MLVRQIFSTKSVNDVITLNSGASVRDAINVLSEKRIGAVVVVDHDGKPLGILSERDVVRELGRRGAESLSDPVDAVMTRKLGTATPDDSADTVLSRMTEGRFRHMPVLDGERMVGLISIGDVVKAQLAELAMEKDALVDMISGR